MSGRATTLAALALVVACVFGVRVLWRDAEQRRRRERQHGDDSFRNLMRGFADASVCIGNAS